MRKTMRKEELLGYFDSEQPKRPSVLRQLLKGKTTSSSLYWGLVYGWLDVIKMDPDLVNEQFKQDIADLVQAGYLAANDDHTVYLTEQGRKYYQEWRHVHWPLQRTKLFADYNIERWRVILRLLVQVCSEFSYANKNYIVVTNDIYAQNQVRRWFSGQSNKQQAVRQFTQLLRVCLANCNPQEADVFANTLIGHQVNGLTNAQISQAENIDEDDITNIVINITNRCLQEWQGSVVQPLITAVSAGGAVPIAAQRTYQEFMQGVPLAKIRQIYHLRQSTVEEHMLDNAIVLDDFPYCHWVSSELYEQLKELAFTGETTIANWRFREAQQLMPELDFITFRLFQIMYVKGEKDGSH